VNSRLLSTALVLLLTLVALAWLNGGSRVLSNLSHPGLLTGNAPGAYKLGAVALACLGLWGIGRLWRGTKTGEKTPDESEEMSAEMPDEPEDKEDTERDEDEE
jgi:hypothetical protein